MDLYCLIHETNFKSLYSILKSGYVLTSGKTQTMVQGQGSKNRRLTNDPTVSLTIPDFYLLYDEVDGVDFAVLKRYKLVINTEENFGFLIAKESVIKQAQFIGEPGFSVTSISKINLLNSVQNLQNSEVLILDNVTIVFLYKIYFNTPPHNNIVETLQFKHIPFL